MIVEPGGLQKSTLIILAARPGMGKSALATNILSNVALKEKKPVLMFNLEMSKAEISKRIIASESLVTNDKINKGMLSTDDWQKIAVAVGNLSEAKLYIDDTPRYKHYGNKVKSKKIKNRTSGFEFNRNRLSAAYTTSCKEKCNKRTRNI